jgi:hypothetical protein
MKSVNPFNPVNLTLKIDVFILRGATSGMATILKIKFSSTAGAALAAWMSVNCLLHK